MNEITETKKFDWFIFISYWIGAHLLINVLRAFISTSYLIDLDNMYASTPSPLLITLSAVFMAILFIAEMLLLKPYMHKAQRWLLYSLAVLPIFGGITWATQNFMGTTPDLDRWAYFGLLSIGGGFITKLSLGIAQWLALRLSFEGTGWWPAILMFAGVAGSIATSIFSFFFAFIAISSISSVSSISSSNYTDTILYMSVFNTLIATFITALITGSALAWFIQHPKDDDMLIDVV